jgi:hypothetical protein
MNLLLLNQIKQKKKKNTKELLLEFNNTINYNSAASDVVEPTIGINVYIIFCDPITVHIKIVKIVNLLLHVT